MNPDIWTKVDDYFGELLHKASPAHDAALQASEEAQLPEIQVSAALGKFLYLLAKMRGAKRILELGTLGGYSTIWLGKALPADGFLLSLEFEPAHAKVAEANLKNANLADQTEIRIGPAIDTLNSLIKEKCEPFDFVFLDADKENYPAYLPKILDLSHSGTVLVADNTKFSRSAPVRIAHVSAIDHVVTDLPPPPEFTAICDEHGVGIYVAERA